MPNMNIHDVEKINIETNQPLDLYNRLGYTSKIKIYSNDFKNGFFKLTLFSNNKIEPIIRDE